MINLKAMKEDMEKDKERRRLLKYSWDELTDKELMEFRQAIEQHRAASDSDLGYPFAFWTALEPDGKYTCIEYFDPDTEKVHRYLYQKRDDGWHWRPKADATIAEMLREIVKGQ